MSLLRLFCRQKFRKNLTLDESQMSIFYKISLSHILLEYITPRPPLTASPAIAFGFSSKFSRRINSRTFSRLGFDDRPDLLVSGRRSRILSSEVCRRPPASELPAATLTTTMTRAARTLIRALLPGRAEALHRVHSSTSIAGGQRPRRVRRMTSSLQEETLTSG